MEKEYTVRPIGVVRSPIREVADDCWGATSATIELDSSQFSPDATVGLEDYSHVEVLFLLDRIDPDGVIRGTRHPRGRKDWPSVGIFAQRAKNRPNRIAVTVCRIESVEGLRIKVSELDAIDGTPVLDLKPYLSGFAPRGVVREPSWAKELMAGYFRPNR